MTNGEEFAIGQNAIARLICVTKVAPLPHLESFYCLHYILCTTILVYIKRLLY